MRYELEVEAWLFTIVRARLSRGAEYRGAWPPPWSVRPLIRLGNLLKCALCLGRKEARLLAFTQSDLDAFDKALADSRGGKVISFSGITVQLDSITERLAYRAFLVRQIAEAAGTAPNRLAVVRKGT